MPQSSSDPWAKDIMPPFIKNSDAIFDDVPDLEPIAFLDSKVKPGEEKNEYKLQIVWRNVIIMTVLHLSALYGLYLCFVSAKWQTSLAGMFFLHTISSVLNETNISLL